jgi:hypothetical protein
MTTAQATNTVITSQVFAASFFEAYQQQQKIMQTIVPKSSMSLQNGEKLFDNNIFPARDSCDPVFVNARTIKYMIAAVDTPV